MSLDFKREACCLTALFAVAFAHSAAVAQDIETVEVGPFTKKTLGTGTNINSGNVACTLTLWDDRGAVFRERADFDICGQKPPLEGLHATTLSIASARSMAASPWSSPCPSGRSCRQRRRPARIWRGRR